MLRDANESILPFDTNYYSLILFTFCPQTINNTNAPSDTHPEELTTTAFAQECHNLFQDDPHVSIEEIIGDELRDRGYGGIYNVGKAANLQRHCCIDLMSRYLGMNWSQERTKLPP
jgi:leucyl aminopeptidase